MKTALPLPDVSHLRAQFSYDPDEGILRWGVRRSGLRFGAPAGTIKEGGHVYVVLDRKHVFAHRVAWKMHYGVEPPPIIDHINGNPSDNRIANLRAATIVENGANRGLDGRNKSGVPGVSLCAQTGKYRASIRVAGRLIALGRFPTIIEAKTARENAEREHYGEFRRAA